MGEMIHIPAPDALQGEPPVETDVADGYLATPAAGKAKGKPRVR